MLVPTPYSIINDPDDGEDVFETIIPTTDAYYTEKRAALWARFHDIGIGNTDKAYWERCMRGKAQSIAGTYDIKFRVFDEYTARLAAATNVDISDGSMESSSVNRTYDPPEATISIIPDVAEEFLAEQNRTDFNQKTYGGLEAATVREYMDAVEDPHEAYAREFDKLFYWGI